MTADTRGRILVVCDAICSGVGTKSSVRIVEQSAPPLSRLMKSLQRRAHRVDGISIAYSVSMLPWTATMLRESFWIDLWMKNLWGL